MSNIIVTGGAGYVGQYVVRRLERDGHTVFVPRKRQYDLRYERDVQNLFDDLPKRDLIIHMAAYVGGIGANRQYPGTYFFDNLIMGAQLIEAAVRRSVSKFVTIGTVCEYPKHTPVPFREDDLWNGYPEETNAPYGIAKKALLVQGQAYRAQYGFNAIHLLLVNVYGPGERYNPDTAHVIPDLIHKMLDAKERGDASVTLWGDGSPTREFIYVEDAAEGIVQAAYQYNKPEPVNIGTGWELPIRLLADKIADEVGYTGQIHWDTSKPNGQPRRCLDVSRAKREFGFVAKTDFFKGITETVKWHVAQREAARA